MKIKEVECKTALSQSSLHGLDYSLNPYRGCQHSCAYCYVPNVLRIERRTWGSFVDVRKNMPSVLSKELKKKKQGVVGISTVTDPYQPVENKYKLTRFCLEQLLIHDFPICIQTKSKLVLRDIDLISKFSDAEVMFSIATLNDSERKLLEPCSSSIQERLDALKSLSKIGIKTSIFFGPIYPTIKLSDISSIIDTFVQVSVSEIIFDKFNLKPGIFENVIKSFPAYNNLIKDISHYKKISNEIVQICNKKNVKAISAF
jgi:DNA repair photolyase